MLSMSPQFNDIFTVYTDVSILVMWRRHEASKKENVITIYKHNFSDNEINSESGRNLLFTVCAFFSIITSLIQFIFFLSSRVSKTADTSLVTFISFHRDFYLFSRFEKIKFPHGGNANRDISSRESDQLQKF